MTTSIAVLLLHWALAHVSLTGLTESPEVRMNPGPLTFAAQLLEACRAPRGWSRYQSASLTFEFPDGWTRKDPPGILGLGQPDEQCYLLVSVDESPDVPGDLRVATAGFLQKAVALHPKATVTRAPQPLTRDDGRSAVVAHWTNVVNGTVARNRLVTFQIPNGVISFQFTAVEAAAASAEPVFDRIQASIRLTDALTAASRAKATASATPAPAATVDLAGTWAGRRSLSMSGGFFPNWADGSSFSLPKFTDPDPPRIFILEFRPNHTYAFVFGQGDVVWTAHSGRFALSRATGEASGRYPFLVTLTPLASTVRVNAARQESLMPAGLSTLDRGPQTFRLREVPGDGIRLIDVREAGWLDDIGYFAMYPQR